MKLNAKGRSSDLLPVSGLPIPTYRESGTLIGNPLRSLQLRDSYRFTLYSLLIPGVKPGTKSGAKVTKLTNL